MINLLVMIISINIISPEGHTNTVLRLQWSDVWLLNEN